MADRDIRERDILVAANEYAYVQDLTKGDIVLYVGPTKISLSNTERLVELKNERFAPVKEDASLGVCPFVTASSGQYIILENPPKDPAVKPLKGSNASIELLTGRKIVVPGPATFPLWPGQKAKVIAGHTLREDEYLVLRVYDKVEGFDHPIGTELIVDGSHVSFYIPRSGLEVVSSDRGYVRKAWRLDKRCGLHLRAVRAFAAKEKGQIPPGNYAAGQEIFLSDREGFFFPTEHVEVLGVVDAIPIAEYQGIYVRHLDSGKVETIVGPRNYLPDPTKVRLVERPLSSERAGLYGLSKHDPKRAIVVHVPPSTAVLVTGGSKRSLVKGPQIRVLAYDEDLEVLRLSTGKPKSDDHLLETCFLQIEGNKVSDVVRMKTGDHVELEVALAYRVSFAGDAERWFNVVNYVDLLCDHAASILRAAARTVSIDLFHAQGTDLLRGAILGEKKGEGGRPGRTFEENGLWVYDLEVLDVQILDEEVELLLGGAQRAAITAEVERKQERLRLSSETLRREVDREIHAAEIASLEQAAAVELSKRRVALAAAETLVERERMERLGKSAVEAEAASIVGRARLALTEEEAAIDRRALEARVAAFEAEMAALAPELIATLKALGNQQLAVELTRNLSPLAILGGESVAEVASRLLSSLPIGSGEGVRTLLAAADRR